MGRDPVTENCKVRRKNTHLVPETQRLYFLLNKAKQLEGEVYYFPCQTSWPLKHKTAHSVSDSHLSIEKATSSNTHFQNMVVRSWKRWLWAFDALAEDQCSICSTHMGVHNWLLTLVPGVQYPLPASTGTMHAYRQNTHPHLKKKTKEKQCSLVSWLDFYTRQLSLTFLSQGPGLQGARPFVAEFEKGGNASH